MRQSSSIHSWQLVTFWTAAVVLTGGAIMGLLFHLPYVWVLCPQALIVMFCRQSQNAYDSLGAADYPDLVVALLYFPVVAWLLTRARRKNNLSRFALWVAIWHLAAIALAIGAAQFRNYVWSIRFGG